MNLNRYRIGLRLGVAFALLAVLASASNVFALLTLSEANDRLRSIVEDKNLRLEMSNQLAAAVQLESRVVRSMLMLDDVARAATEKRKIDQARVRYEKAWQTLSTLPASEEAAASRTVIAESHAALMPIHDRVISMALANADDAGRDLLLGPGLQVATKLLNDLDANLALVKQENLGTYQASQSDHGHAMLVMAATTAAALLLSVWLAWVITRSITRPLAGAVALADAVAEGRLDTRLSVEGQDEVAALCHSISTMRDNLNQVVSAVRVNAESVSTASAEIAQGNLDLSQRTEQQASALQQTAASMEQLNSTVGQNAANARQASQLAQGASSVALQGGTVVTEVVTTMRGINESSKRIADIIGVIDGIAFQTNILALNAAVEAARAGEQGRGFAVVALEVRNLAGRSAEAAREIKSLIATSVERVDHGSALVDRAGATMTQVVAAIQRVTDIVAEISVASQQQSSGVAQVGQAVTQMDRATQQNAALVEESAASAESLRQQAATLVGLVERFKTTQPGAMTATAARPAPA